MVLSENLWSVLKHMMLEEDADDFEEPESEDDVQHYGVLGMKWGVRKDPQKAYTKANQKLTALDKKATKQAAKAARKEKRSVVRQRRADTALLFPKTKARLADWAIGRSEKAQYNYTKRVAKATDWYKKMENAFRDVEVSNLNPQYVSLGEKYANMNITQLMSNAQNSAANKELRLYYRQMGR